MPISQSDGSLEFRNWKFGFVSDFDIWISVFIVGETLKSAKTTVC